MATNQMHADRPGRPGRIDPPGGDAPTGDRHADLRAQLQQREAQLGDALRGYLERLGEPAAATANTFVAGHEGAVVDADDERDVALLRRAQHELNELRAALRRLDEGRYGDCERCGAPIGMARLRALPQARLCVGCQRDAEGSGRNG